MINLYSNIDNVLMKLDKETYTPFMSNYLQSGWMKHICEVTSVSVDKNNILAYVDILGYSMPDDGIYHFTADVAFRVVSQLLMIHTGWAFDCQKKIGESYLREYNSIYNKKINKTCDIKVLGTINEFNIKKNKYAMLNATFDIEEGSFVIDISGSIPIAELP